MPVGAVTSTVLFDEDAVATVRFEPPLILYVNVYGAIPLAPVNVTCGAVEFLQTAVVPLILAVGIEFTVTVIELLCVQPVAAIVSVRV